MVQANDILVSGVDKEEQLNNMEKVLERLIEAGRRAKKAKCMFMGPEVHGLPG